MVDFVFLIFLVLTVTSGTSFANSDINNRKYNSNNEISNSKSFSQEISTKQHRSLLSRPIIPIQNVFWMHIQKTSAWVGDLILRWGCLNIDLNYTVDPENKLFLSDRVRHNVSAFPCTFKILGTEYLHYGHHVPFDPEFWKGAGVTILRSPVNRLISAFLFADGIMIPRGFYNYDLEQEVRKNVTSSSHPIYTYAMTRGISQCQAKMIMGYDCGNDVPMFNSKQLKEVHRRLLEDFIFVGLQEESKATYELWIAMFGIGHLNDPLIVERGLPPPYQLSYRRNVENEDKRREELKRELREMKWVDKADEFTYEVGKKIFYKRCEEYRIKTKYGSERRR